MTTFSRPGVFINELPLSAAPIEGAAAATAAGAVIAAFAQGPETVTKVTSWYDFSRRFGGYNKKYPATFQVAAFFKNGGTDLYVRRILPADATTAAAVVPVNHSNSGNLLKLKAKNRGADGNNIRVKFTKSTLVKQTGYWDLSVYLEGPTSSTSDDILVEQFNGVVFNDADSSDFITNVLEFNSSFIKVDSTVSVNTSDTYGPVTTLIPLAGATTPDSDLVYADYTGDDTGDNGEAPDTLNPTNASVFQEFEVLGLPLVVFLPDVVTRLEWGQGVKVYNLLTAWAETTTAVLVVETAPDLTPVEAMTAANDLTDSSRVAVYYPHVYVQDPLGKSSAAVRKIGPSGAVAGLYIYTDTKVGPFKTPAGVDARIQDAIALERSFTPKDLDQLNSGVTSAGVALTNLNAIRNLPGAGIVVMGGRTTLQDGTANRYINMRRSLIYIEKRLSDLLQFAIFENNTEVLWARINTMVGAFLNEYRNQGGLRGTTSAASFFVKCDEENNTPVSIAAGEVHVEVGVALEYPAEFIVINLSQKTAE